MKFKSTVVLFWALLQISSISTFTIADANGSNKEFEQYWKETGLTFNTLQELVNNKTCKKDQDVFIACFKAINTLLAYHATPAVLVTSHGLQTRTDLGAHVKSFGKIVATKLVPQKTKKKETLIERNERLKSERAATQSNLVDLYQSKRVVDFNDILSWAKNRDAKSTNRASVVATAINTYLSVAFDPHTYIMPTNMQNDQMASETESFVGVGIILQLVNGQVIVDRPVENSPALAAGVRAKDQITYIDGVSVSGMTINQIVEKVRGPEGTKVSLSLERASEGISLNVDIVRAPIVTENVESKMIGHGYEQYGYIKLRSFMEKASCEKIRKAVSELEAQGAQGFILDLRDNGGGLVSQAVCITSLFVGAGNIAVEIRNLASGSQTQKYPTYPIKSTNLPMITLINSSSASASEIVSGALQDLQRSVILGERSFGKGSVQMGQAFKSNSKIVLMSTMARFYMPSGRTNQILGIVPDIEVYEKPFPTKEETLSFREEDLYENALPPIGKPWTQPRAIEMDNLYECMMGTGFAYFDFQKAQNGNNDPMPPDYQALMAEDALRCMSK